MASVNKVILVGNLCKDPVARTMESGNTVCNFSMATNEEWKDKQGQKQSKVEYHNISTWGKTAEICEKYLAKGKQVYIEGKLQTRSYEKDGVTKYVTEINANSVQFLGNKSESQKVTTPEFTADDVPF